MRVAFFTFQFEIALANVVGQQDGADFLERFVLDDLDVAKFGIDVFDEVGERGFDGGAGGCGADVQSLADGVVVGFDHEFGDQGDQTGTAFAVFLGAVGEDAFEGGCGGGVAFLVDVLFGLQPGSDFAAQFLVIAQLDQHPAAVFVAAADALGGAVERVVVG